MSNPAKPAWPDLTSLPFTLFGQPPASAAANALGQGLAGGVDAMKSFWGKLPGGSALPGFMVPTLDLGELDKRISDLRAAESWLEVNLNVLRATIQGLEVQRHTIAAIQSLSAMNDGPPKPAEAPADGLPAGWPRPAPAEPVRPAPAPPAPEVLAPVPEAAPAEAPAESSSESSTPVSAMAGLAANNWLGFMQDQFNKVAQAALAGSVAPVDVPSDSQGARRPAGARSPARKAAKKSTARRSPAR